MAEQFIQQSIGGKHFTFLSIDNLLQDKKYNHNRINKRNKRGNNFK